MVPRFVSLHYKTYSRLAQLVKEAERDGAYRVAKRLQAVLLNSQGRSSGELASILRAPRSKVSEWLANYEKYGVEGLLEGYRSGRPPFLEESQLQSLYNIVESGPVAYGLDAGVWTSPMICRIIEEEFGVSYHAATFADFFTSSVSPCRGPAGFWHVPIGSNRIDGTEKPIRT